MASNATEEETGYSNIQQLSDPDCEWRMRPIHLFGILNSVVSQLRPSQDMTKFSLPSELCHPFSMLEVISYRQLTYFGRLFAVEEEIADDDDKGEEESSEKRFVAALRWVMAILKPEFAHKKPFNPVIGEHHLCWVENGEDDWTEFISEQVSHHPPVSSFFIRNKKRGIQMEGNLKFGVVFGGNHAAVTTEGVVTITTPHEVFHLEKSLPNMMINNIVFGTKYVLWDGSLSITSDSGWEGTMHLSEESPDKNKIEGKVTKDGKDVFTLSGLVGTKVKLTRVDDEEASKITIYTSSDCEGDVIRYPPPSAQLRMDSLSLWKSTSEAIIKNDLSTADAEKIRVETAQRKKEKARKEAGEPYDAKFFYNTTDNEESANWKFKDEVVVDRDYIEKLKELKQEEDSQQPSDEEEEDEEEGDNGGEHRKLKSRSPRDIGKTFLIPFRSKEKKKRG